jgi:4-aminobutyrate aminotransferase-like enzyme
VIEEEKLVERAAETGARALRHLRRRLSGLSGIAEVRGLGLLLAIECEDGLRAARAGAGALRRGVIVLTSGESGRVLSITPPLSIEPEALELALDLLAEALA